MSLLHVVIQRLFRLHWLRLLRHWLLHVIVQGLLGLRLILWFRLILRLRLRLIFRLRLRLWLVLRLRLVLGLRRLLLGVRGSGYRARGGANCSRTIEGFKNTSGLPPGKNKTQPGNYMNCTKRRKNVYRTGICSNFLKDMKKVVEGEQR